MAAIFALNSGIVLYAAQFSGGVAAVWSANAILLFALMISPKQHHLPYYIGAFAASLCANVAGNFGWVMATAFSVANMLEVSLATCLLSRTQDRNQDFISPRNLADFALVSITVPALSASIAAFASSSGFFQDWISWYVSDVLGLLLLVPSLWVLRSYFRDGAASNWSKAKLIECAVVLTIIVAAALAAFGQEKVPLLIVTVVPQLLAVFRGGAIGAVLSTVIFAVIAATATLLGHGTIVMWTSDPMHQIWLLQGYLVCQLLVSLPVATVLADRDAKAAKIVEQERELRSLAEAGQRAAELAGRQNAMMLAHDELTGVLSRRRILQKLDQAMGVAINSGTPLSVALFDVDNFKLINDRFGHAVGDDVLRLIGQIVNARVPRRFPVGRIGGEEFLILFPGLTAAEASEYGERLRTAVMTGTRSGDVTAVTISLGIGAAQAGQSIRTLLASADGALYEAKATGRNRMALAA